MTDDEDEILTKQEFEREQWYIKRDIRISFKRESKPPETKFEYYKLGRVIGTGPISKVSMAMHILTRKLVAIKSVNKNREGVKEEWEKIKNEIEILKKVRHPNIVKMYEEMESNTHYMYYMELCQGGNLY